MYVRSDRVVLMLMLEKVALLDLLSEMAQVGKRRFPRIRNQPATPRRRFGPRAKASSCVPKVCPIRDGKEVKHVKTNRTPAIVWG